MKIVEINRNNVHLNIYRGFLLLKEKEQEIAREPLVDIDCLLVHGFGISYSHNLLSKLCELNIPLIVCGNNFMPAGYLLSYCSNFEFTGRLHNQINTSLPLKKNLWKTLIKSKILNQKKVLNFIGDEAKDFDHLISKVRSGDPENVESQAAVKYWRRAFGINFRRDFDLQGINSFLNFGYAILRACSSRYLVASGLSPALGIHHKNKLNAFCLADDIIEPFRPYIDRKILEMKITDKHSLNPVFKKELVSILEQKFLIEDEYNTLSVCMKKTVQSLSISYRDNKNFLKLPEFHD